jgi:hypothetical protein
MKQTWRLSGWLAGQRFMCAASQNRARSASATVWPW